MSAVTGRRWNRKQVVLWVDTDADASDGFGLNCSCFRWMGQVDSTFRSSDICGIRSNSGRWEFSFPSLSFYKKSSFSSTLYNIIHSLCWTGQVSTPTYVYRVVLPTFCVSCGHICSSFRSITDALWLESDFRKIWDISNMADRMWSLRWFQFTWGLRGNARPGI